MQDGAAASELSVLKILQFVFFISALYLSGFFFLNPPQKNLTLYLNKLRLILLDLWQLIVPHL